MWLGSVSGAAIWALGPVSKVWIHDEGLATSRFSMMRIMARRMKAATVLASKKTEPGKVRLSSALVSWEIVITGRAGWLPGPSRSLDARRRHRNNLIVIQTTWNSAAPLIVCR
jgi:hypothetical protein